MHKISVVRWKTQDFRQCEQTFPELSVSAAAAAALGEIRSDLPENTEGEIKLLGKEKPQRTRSKSVWKNKASAPGFQ